MMNESSLVTAAMPSPSNVADSSKAVSYEFHPSIAEEERRFYLKAYPTVDIVRDRKVHCTVCKTHIGTAPIQEVGIKMHPILRVTHCMKCHDFYNSGEFSKGEDGSELYCRWCGQGGEVYCCSSCPYVFCKSCIVKNLSRGVVADIEQNENWNCFSCAPKILWPLRAQHWALMNYIEQQRKEVQTMNLNETEFKQYLQKDRSKCCRLAKAKCGNMSDSMESLDSVTSKRSHGSSGSAKKAAKHSATPSPQPPNAKRPKNNDEVVCTPDLLSMLEPDCQITLSQKPAQRPMMPSPSATQPRIMSIQQPGYGLNSSTPKSSAPPPLVLRNTAIKLRPAAQPPIVRRTVIGPRAPAPGGNGTPVYHTINGYRIDLNSAAQQETFRLPNGKLIQVKRQGPPPGSNTIHLSTTTNSWQQMQGQQPPAPQQRVVPQTIASRPVQITQHTYASPHVQQHNAAQHPQIVRYHNSMIGSTTINAVGHNGTPLQAMNGQISSGPPPNIQQQQQQQLAPGAPIRPVMVRHIFPDNPIGQARTQLQEQVFNAMEICTHLTNKVQTLTNSNAYKQAKNYLEVKELYIHLSYLLTYAVGRFKGLQDKCLADMRHLGFGNDADCLENGQLAAAIDYVCYGQLDDVDLFNTGSNSFHNQVYEYRKSLHANLKDGEDGAKSPLPPLFPLGQSKSDEAPEDDGDGEDSLLEAPRPNMKSHWPDGGDDSLGAGGYGQENEENEEPDESYFDNDDDDGFGRSMGYGAGSFVQGTEESMRRNEETHAYDRKLTRLVSQYPSIWCTRHPDYGNFEVTRKQWRTILAHFDRGENIKLRWKNIRKRFVRIEKRIAEGKRFNGHFDKAMAFLANRDLQPDQWVNVDCGEDDGDTFDRQNLDAIEQSLHRQGKDDFLDKRDRGKESGHRDMYNYQPAVKPIEIEPLDLKIITFVKTNPVLWRKSMDPEADKIDEETRVTVWNQLHKSLQSVSCEYIRDRWQHLYEMYKTFRLKTIKSHNDRSNLELKYSKYLAKLYFLYKIDEAELRNENNGLFEDCFELEDDEEEEAAEAETDAERGTAADTEGDSGGEDTATDVDKDKEEDNDTEKETEGVGENANAGDTTTSASAPMSTTKLQDMADDKEFLQKLVQNVREYPAIWNTQHTDYNDIMIRDNYWQEIYEKLVDYKHKQASDDEDNEIEIVEPKTDLINLDSDDDEPPPTKILKPIMTSTPTATHARVSLATPTNVQKPANDIMTTPITPMHSALATPNLEDDNMDLMTMAQSFLASMLEVDIHEGALNSPSSSDSTHVKKQPRKKTTNKPNPTLLKQKALMERERLEEMKRNDHKLKMKCAVQLKKAEDEYPYAKEMLEAKLREKQNLEEKAKEREIMKEREKMKETPTTMMVNTGKETIEVQLVIEDDNMNSSTEEKQLEKVTKAIINIDQPGDADHGDEEREQGTIQKKIILIEEEEEYKTTEKGGKEVKDTKESNEKKEVKDDKETEEVEGVNDKDKAENVDEIKTKDILKISDEVEDKDKSVEILETPTKEDTSEPDNKEGSRSPSAVVDKEKGEEEDMKEDVTEEDMKEDITEEDMKEDLTEDTKAPLNGVTNEKDEDTNIDDSKMEVDLSDETDTAKTTKDSKINETNEANKSNEDLEDAEVYKEIEKVLQRRHDSEENDEDETEKEVISEAEMQEEENKTDETSVKESAISEDVDKKEVESVDTSINCTEQITSDAEGSNESKEETPKEKEKLNDTESVNEIETECDTERQKKEKESLDSDALNKAGAEEEIVEKVTEKDSTDTEGGGAATTTTDTEAPDLDDKTEKASSPCTTTPPLLDKSESNISSKVSVTTTDSGCGESTSPAAGDECSDNENIETKEQSTTVPPAKSCDPEEITSNGNV